MIINHSPVIDSRFGFTVGTTDRDKLLYAIRISFCPDFRGSLARIIHDSTLFFISAQCTRAVCLS
jgi:hypothetical protein